MLSTELRSCYHVTFGHVTTLDTVTRILCTLLFLIHVPLVHGYTNSQNTVNSYIVIIVTWMLGTQLYHVYTSLLHMHILFLYSCHMDHRSYCISYCCMYIPVFLLYDCFRYWYWFFRYWIRELLICDVWNPTSIVSRFPLSCFMLSTELKFGYRVTCIMYYSCSWYPVHIQCIKYKMGLGETWWLTRSCRVDIWIHYLSHCWGRDSAGYRLL